MHAQNQVKRTLRERLSEVRAALAGGSGRSRTAVADNLCDQFGLVDARGCRQRGSCLKALRDLEAGGYLVLPASRCRHRNARSPRRLGHAVEPPVGVPERVDLIGHLELALVRTDSDLGIWNELMIQEHPLGDGPLVGRQLRYLLLSEHGCLGAVGFASCALHLRARDQWIGWNWETRSAHLDKIVCMSRFLIRPQVACANLASKALAMACQALPGDFELRYGYRPWLLESFVDPQEHAASCYRAANWTRVGTTCGRGRQDVARRAEKPRKDIYMHVLDDRFREHLNVPESIPYPPLAVTEAADGESWADTEFGGAQMGDKRLERRLISIVRSKAKSPAAPFVEAVRGDRAAVAGYYRFIDAPDESCVTMEAMLRPHRDCTLRRMNGQKEVLCLHDSTDINFATLAACKGLGVVGKNQTKTETRGLRLHSSLAVSPDEGLPLGVLHAYCYAPQIGKKSRRKDPRYVPAEEKETYRWITSLQACTRLTQRLAGTRVTHVMDREGDFFELFDAWREGGADQLVVRAKHDRRTGSDRSLFERVGQAAVAGVILVEVPRKSARPKKGKSEAQPPRQSRQATLEVRYCQVPILPPRNGLSSGKSPVDVSVVHVSERDAPADGSRRIEWYLITTLPVDSLEAAEHVFECYVKRWRVEEWHRALKTCCGAEEPAHRNAERQKRLLAINMVIAWRVMLMTLLGREVPNLPPEIMFGDDEIKVLDRLARQWRQKAPAGLGDYVRLTARLGGYLDRNGDLPPGVEVLWRGLTTLTHMAMGFALFQRE